MFGTLCGCVFVDGWHRTCGVGGVSLGAATTPGMQGARIAALLVAWSRCVGVGRLCVGPTVVEGLMRPACRPVGEWGRCLVPVGVDKAAPGMLLP